MSDETRRVTVEQLARALGQEIHVDADHGFPETTNVNAVAHSIFAALPTSTEGLDVERLAEAQAAVDLNLAPDDPTNRIAYPD